MNDQLSDRSRSIDINLSKLFDKAKEQQQHKVTLGDILKKSQISIKDNIKRSQTPTLEDKENRELTFKPQINKYPSYLKSATFLERNEQWQKNKILKQQETNKSFMEEKEKALAKECSFKPKITVHQISQTKIQRQQKQQQIQHIQQTKQNTPNISMQTIQYELRKQLYGIKL